MVTMAVYRGGTKVKFHSICWSKLGMSWFLFKQVARSFRPDFVLIRQPPRDGSRDFRSTLLGLKYGGVPCINSLNSIYQFQVCVFCLSIFLNLFFCWGCGENKSSFWSKKWAQKQPNNCPRALMFGICLVAICACYFIQHFSIVCFAAVCSFLFCFDQKRFYWTIEKTKPKPFQDKPWIFAHLLQLQRRQGRDAFPLIEQTFFPNAKDLVSETFVNFSLKICSPCWWRLSQFAFAKL